MDKDMIHVCTVCDSKYLLKGLALYQSLKNTIGEGKFTLHWLCIDLDIYGTLIQELDLPETVLYHLEDLETEQPELLLAKNNPPSKYGDAYSQYCWTLTPFFIHYLLTHVDIDGIDKLIYADSDIFFYQSPQIILDAVGEKAVGIHTHRFTPPYNDDLDVGWYNVGVMVFNNSVEGRAISWFWKNLLLDTSNPFYEKYGTCGDQRYLNLFIPLFGRDKICVFDEDAGILHKAPWCPDGPPNIAFYHFSHFNHDFATDTWRDYNNVDKPEWRPSTYPGLWKVYQDYYEAIKRADGMGMNGASVDAVANLKQVVVKTPTTKIDFSIDIIG